MKQTLLLHLLPKPRAAFGAKRTRLTWRFTFSILLLLGWAFTAFAQSACDEPNVTHYLVYYADYTTSEGANPYNGCVEEYARSRTVINTDIKIAVKKRPGSRSVEPFLTGSYESIEEWGGRPQCSRYGYWAPESAKEVVTFDVPGAGAAKGLLLVTASESLDGAYNTIRDANTKMTCTPGVGGDGICYWTTIITRPTVVAYYNSKQLADLVAQGDGAQLALSESSLPECICRQTYTTTCYRRVTCPDGNYGCLEPYPCTKSICDKNQQPPPCALEPTIKVRAQ